MKKFFNFETWTIGLAMFSMFFGAGNIIFPLAVGQIASDLAPYAILGLILTAALMPIMGIIAMILFNGSYKDFFGRIGKIPGFSLALLTISLLGPLGSTPRCISLAYSTLAPFIPWVSPLVFYALSCLFIYFCCIKKTKIIPLLGLFLTPFLLLSLMTIIILGFITPHVPVISLSNPGEMFFFGLKEGYNTMDLLASFFFSSTILGLVTLKHSQEKSSSGSPILVVLKASFIGIFLLSLIYVGFSYLASFHAAGLQSIPKDMLLSFLTTKIAGPYAGLLVLSATSLACLTTAIALISAFTDFIQKEVTKDKVSYPVILGSSLALTFIISCFQFGGISAFLGPILEICYPGLIVLTLLNIAYKMRRYQSIKVPVFTTFALATIRYFY